MKRILTTAILAITIVGLTYGREPQRGYRGFFDWDNSIGSMPYFDHSTGQDEKDLQWVLGWSTVHGYQINNHIFIGAGILVAYGLPSLDCTLPVFLDFRYDRSFNKFRPFGDVRIGYNLTDGGGLYFSPSVGHRFNWGRKVGLNIGVGLTLRGRTSEIYKFDVASDPSSPLFEIRYLGRKHYTDAFFTFRLGLDF